MLLPSAIGGKRKAAHGETDKFGHGFFASQLFPIKSKLVLVDHMLSVSSERVLPALRTDGRINMQ